MKKVIVTGGLGFIGSNLIDLLISKNYFVINIDKVTYSSNFYNTKEYKNSNRYKFIKYSIRLLPINPSPPVTINLAIYTILLIKSAIYFAFCIETLWWTGIAKYLFSA